MESSSTHPRQLATTEGNTASTENRNAQSNVTNGVGGTPTRATNTGNGNAAGGKRGRQKSRGGGRGGRDGQNRGEGRSQPVKASRGQNATTAPPPPQPGGGSGVFAARPSKDADNTITSGDKTTPEYETVEAEVCFICASAVTHNSVAPCNHRTCHICALRLRALYKTKACAHCRAETATIIFTDEGEKRYEDFRQKDFVHRDNNLGIVYDSTNIYEDTVLLLRYNCPDSECDVACLGWPDLHRHVRSQHQKVMCDLCTRHKKIFTHEHQLFTPTELKKHERSGDDNPGAVNQSGFVGHPECGFCRRRFYGDDELYAHCRERHERCHICDRQTGGATPQYYVDYNALEAHFNKDHWPCLDTECQEKKFVVFYTEMDLKAHQLESHPNDLSKDARRDARRVDISSFEYRPPYQEVGRGGRRGGRGRDPNAPDMPGTSATHVSRAELAHQRQRDVHSAQNVTTRTFGGSLTQTPPDRTPHAPSSRPRGAAPSTAPSNPTETWDSLTPAEQARRLRHDAVTSRAAHLLHHNQIHIDAFRTRISSYRTGAITATHLVEAFLALFDCSSAELATLLHELADIFELPDKRTALLRAWSDWKAVHEDYPSLPAPPGPPAEPAAASRVLQLKSASSRSRTGPPRSWGTAPSSSSATGSAFPALPPAATAATSKPPPASNGWVGVQASPARAARVSARVSPATSRAPSSTRLAGGTGGTTTAATAAATEAFPALPAAQRPMSTMFTPGYAGAGVRRPVVAGAGAAASAWGARNGGGAVAEVEVEGERDGGGGKGKGKKKQVVFKWG